MSEEEQLAIATKILELTPKDPEFHVLAQKLPLQPPYRYGAESTLCS